VRAALEGVAQRCADVIAALPGDIPTLRVDGGLAQSDVLLQRIADFSGCEIQRAAETETTALGAAFLAALAVGLLSSADEVPGLLSAPTRFVPGLTTAERERARSDWGRALSRSQARGYRARFESAEADSPAGSSDPS
jgi:glycerol kinase